MHSPIEKASSGKYIWRRRNSCTLRTVQSAHREVMANAPTNESRCHMSKLQSQMRSRLSLGDQDSVSTIPRYTAATGNQLENQFYPINMAPKDAVWDELSAELRRTKGGWLYRDQKQPLPHTITVPEVQGGYTMERTYRQRITAGEESTSAPGDKTTSEFRKRWDGYPDKWQQAHLEMERNAYQEESRQAHPTIGDDKCTKHRADVMYTYKCTDLKDNQWDCKSTRGMMRTTSDCDLCWTSAYMSDWEDLIEIENDFRTDGRVYQTAWRVTITEQHSKRHSPNGIMRDHWDNYEKMITGLPWMEGART